MKSYALNIFLAEADTAHLIFAHTLNFDHITKCEDILYTVYTSLVKFGDMNHTLFTWSKLKECTEVFDAYNMMK